MNAGEIAQMAAGSGVGAHGAGAYSADDPRATSYLSSAILGCTLYREQGVQLRNRQNRHVVMLMRNGALQHLPDGEQKEDE